MFALMCFGCEMQNDAKFEEFCANVLYNVGRGRFGAGALWKFYIVGAQLNIHASDARFRRVFTDFYGKIKRREADAYVF